MNLPSSMAASQRSRRLAMTLTANGRRVCGEHLEHIGDLLSTGVWGWAVKPDADRRASPEIQGTFFAGKRGTTVMNTASAPPYQE